MGKRIPVAVALAAAAILLLIAAGASAGGGLTPEQQLGKALFFDESLSLNSNQSCATCHAPDAGWVGPDSGINAHGAVYEGSIPGAFGDRKPPSAAYATQSPILSVDKKGLFVGGNFWDGRATGETLGSPAAEQAKGPFLNPKEQALPDASALVGKVCASDSYGDLFTQLWGAAACLPENVATAYDAIGYSIAAYEASPEVNAFSSKYDLSLKGKARLSKQERLGFSLFQGKAQCTKCHLGTGPGALFTDYTFDNLGIPKNPENPVYTYDSDFVDPGLGGFLAHRADYASYSAANIGKHKVPTLRNIDMRPTSGTIKAYGHNGYFKSLKGIVHFYNTRDILLTCPGPYTEAEALAADCWPVPEEAANMNTAELGNLGLTAEEEVAIVAFMKALSDGYAP
jgi:cytochrome c peroxidase